MITSVEDFALLCDHYVQTCDTTAPSEALQRKLKIAHRTTKAIERLTATLLDALRGEDAFSCVRHATTAYRITATSTPPTESDTKQCCISHAKHTNRVSVVFTFAGDTGDVKLSREFVITELWLRALQALLILSRRRDYIQLTEQQSSDEDRSTLRKELMLYFNHAFTFVQMMINTLPCCFLKVVAVLLLLLLLLSIGCVSFCDVQKNTVH